MKTIGLIGGMSWESSVSYYQIINQTVKRELGGLHSAKCILYSVDFYEIERCQANGDWNKSAEILSIAATSLEKAGADLILICTNTMHKVADIIQSQVKIPLLHIGEMTAQQLKQTSVKKVALLGTKYTMEQDFYKNKLIENGLSVLIPDDKQREIVNHIIYEELCKGVILPASKQKFIDIIDQLALQGAEGVILGCTEIGLLIQQADCTLPVFDTTQIHAEQAVFYALTAV